MADEGWTASGYFGSMSEEYDSLIHRAVPRYDSMTERLVEHFVTWEPPIISTCRWRPRASPLYRLLEDHFAEYLLYNRALLGDLSRVAARTITAFIRTTVGERGLSVGVVASIQTHRSRAQIRRAFGLSSILSYSPRWSGSTPPGRW